MKYKTLMLLLGVSLLFNVSVLIGFAKAKSHNKAIETSDAQTGAEMSDDMLLNRIATDLKLDERQLARFSELRENQRKAVAEHDQNVAALREKIQNELKNESSDAEQLRGLFGARADLERQRRMVGAEQFGEFLRVLTPQQRKMLSGRIGPRPQRHPAGGVGGPGGPRDGMRESPRDGMGGPGGGGNNNGGPPPVKLDRFDLNHNNQLESNEIEAAQKEIMARHQLMMRKTQPQLPPIGPEELRRFDANQDGRLDDQERAALQKFRRENPPANRPGQRPGIGRGQGRDGDNGPGIGRDPNENEQTDASPPPPPDDEVENPHDQPSPPRAM